MEKAGTWSTGGSEAVCGNQPKDVARCSTGRENDAASELTSIAGKPKFSQFNFCRIRRTAPGIATTAPSALSIKTVILFSQGTRL
jgi:hypothetical protein